MKNKRVTTVEQAKSQTSDNIRHLNICDIQIDNRYRKSFGDTEEAAVAKGQERLTPESTVPVELLAKPVQVNTITEGDCRKLIPALPDKAINLALTSPPYAEQRKGLYPGVPEAEYPQFTVDWMGKLWDKLADDGSVLIVIRPHLRKGVVSDYVLRTRIALRELGWKESEELIWHKADGGHGTGSNHRLKRSFENILWFSKSSKPYVDTKACGGWTDRLTLFGNQRFGTGSGKPFHSAPTSEKKTGRTRGSDVFSVPVSKNSKGVMHPAMFPVRLAEELIKTFCPSGGTVLDCFAGSGTTCLAAKKLGRQYYGFDIMPDFVEIARQRLVA